MNDNKFNPPLAHTTNSVSYTAYSKPQLAVKPTGFSKTETDIRMNELGLDDDDDDGDNEEPDYMVSLRNSGNTVNYYCSKTATISRRF